MTFLRELTDSGRVQSGPFAGLNYGAHASFGSPIPFLVGSYEEELHPAIVRAIQRDYSRVVDIGCAEGYYAVGFALRMPAAEVFAFDLDPEAQRMCREMAERNGVSDRVHVGGACTVEDLDRLIVSRTLVISDCEGFEAELLNPSRAPALLDGDFIVEMHDFIEPTISATIRQRFAATHDIELVDAQPRSSARYPSLAGLSPKFQQQTLDEGRPRDPYPMQWAIMLRRG